MAASAVTDHHRLKVHTIGSKQQDTRALTERDDALKQCSDLRRRHCHFQHELKRREQEYERLQVDHIAAEHVKPAAGCARPSVHDLLCITLQGGLLL